MTGCEVGCTSPLLVKLLGLYCLTQAFAIMTALRGIAALVGPPTAGILVDKFQDPGLALLLCGALMVSATIVTSIAALLNKVMERREGYVQLKYQNSFLFFNQWYKYHIFRQIFQYLLKRKQKLSFLAKSFLGYL